MYKNDNVSITSPYVVLLIANYTIRCIAVCDVNNLFSGFLKSNFGSCIHWQDSNLHHTYCRNVVLSNFKITLFKAFIFNLNNMHLGTLVELDLTHAAF